MNAKRAAKYHYLKFRRLRGNPHSLALGSAIGAFMAVMPIMPFRTVVIIASTAFIKASTLAALIVGTVISNPFTYVPLYYGAFVTGNAMMPHKIDWERVQPVLDTLGSGAGVSSSTDALLSLGFETLVALMVGGLTLAIPVGLSTYAVSLFFFSRRRHGSSNKRPSICNAE